MFHLLITFALNIYLDTSLGGGGWRTYSLLSYLPCMLSLARRVFTIPFLLACACWKTCYTCHIIFDWKNWKISGPNGLSKCPESREIDFGNFGEKYVRHFFDHFLIIFQNPDLEVQNPDLFMTELSCHPLGARI